MEPNLAASGTTPPVAGAAGLLLSGGTPSPMIGAVTYPANGFMQLVRDSKKEDAFSK